jgi:hypothetical protein
MAVVVEKHRSLVTSFPWLLPSGSLRSGSSCLSIKTARVYRMKILKKDVLASVKYVLFQAGFATLL